MARQLTFLERLGLVRPKKSKAKEPEDLYFQGHSVEIVRKPHHRKLSLSVHTNGRARITVSRSTPVKVISDFLMQNADWVQKKFNEFEQLRSKHPPKKFMNGERLIFLGEEHELVLLKTPQQKVRITRRDGCLVCFRHENTPHEKLRKAVLDFYEQEARTFLTDRIEYWSNKMGLRPQTLSFRSQKTRWGSCSSKGRITLNWRLIGAPIGVLDYVLIHELGHLRHPNHSRNFWDLVREYSPNMSEHKSWLRHHHYDLDFLSKTSDLHAP